MLDNFTKGGARGWIVTAPFVWSLGNKDSAVKVTIAQGYEFESSVPWYARWILNPDDPRFLLAACIHDWLLEGGFRQVSSDLEWWDGARKGGAPWLLRTSITVAMLLRRAIQFSVSKFKNK